MARKRVGSLGWPDGAVAGVQCHRRDCLGKISALLDWSRFEAALSGIHVARRGEPSYPPIVMFRVLLLQRRCGLSAPAMEETLYDRLPFRRFVGLALENETPDHSTIFRFRD